MAFFPRYSGAFWRYTDFLKRYCDYLDLPYDDYKIFMNSNEPSDILRASENFKNYFEDYSQKSPKIFKKGKEKDEVMFYPNTSSYQH